MANGFKATDQVVSYPVPSDIGDLWREFCKANDLYLEKDMAALMKASPYLTPQLHNVLIGVIERKTPWAVVEPVLKAMQAAIEKIVQQQWPDLWPRQSEQSGTSLRSDTGAVGFPYGP